MIRDGVRLVDGTYFSWNGLTIGVSVVGCFFLAAVNDVTSVRQETRRCLTTIDPSETETYKKSTEKKHKKTPIQCPHANPQIECVDSDQASTIWNESAFQWPIRHRLYTGFQWPF